MSIFERWALLRGVKSVLKRTVLRPGTRVPILRGPLRGYRYIVNEDSGWASIYGGWEPAAAAAYERFIKPGHVVYDLGANTGIHSLLFAKLAGPRGRVVAFEPLPRNVAHIESLLTLNDVRNLDVLALAVASEAGTATFKLGKSAKQGSLVGIGREASEEVKVRVDTLDALIERGLAPPDFVKIDIEGAESAALAGFRGTIGRSFPTFAIDLHTPDEDVRVASFLKEHGYTLYRLREEAAVKKTGQKELLLKIPRHDVGWPEVDGVWGTILAIHPTREPS